METVTIHTAKTTLSQLLVRVEAGEEIIVSRGQKPIAKTVPFTPAMSRLRSRITVSFTCRCQCDAARSRAPCLAHTRVPSTAC